MQKTPPFPLHYYWFCHHQSSYLSLSLFPNTRLNPKRGITRCITTTLRYLQMAPDLRVIRSIQAEIARWVKMVGRCERDGEIIEWSGRVLRRLHLSGILALLLFPPSCTQEKCRWKVLCSSLKFILGFSYKHIIELCLIKQ